MIRTAVFPVAGIGTRLLPTTKAIPKEMLPVVDKPLIQYAVDEALHAGIDNFIFVTSSRKAAIEAHFDTAPALVGALIASGKDHLISSVRDVLPPHASAIFVQQRGQLGLGHAVLCARQAIGREPFAVLLADDFIIPSPGSSNPTAALITAFVSSGQSQVLLQEVPADETHKYGIAIPGADPSSIIGLVEKPSPGEAPSNFASIGRYVLHQDIFDVLETLSPGRGGEIQLSKAIHVLARSERVKACALNGERHDCGTHLGYLGAIIAKAVSHPEHGAAARDLMETALSAQLKRV